MRLCAVNIHTQEMPIGQIEQKMYFVQDESLGLVMECLQGLEKLGRARVVSMEQLNAMSEIGKLFGGEVPNDPADPKTT